MSKLEHPKKKIGKESVEFSAEVADIWSATMDDMDITSTTCDDVDEKFDIDDENWDHYWNTVDVVADEILPAIVLEREKECDVTAGEQTRKKTTWLKLDRVMLRVLKEVYKHTWWWYELCRDEKCEGCSQQQVWRQQVRPRQWRLLAWCDPRRSAESCLTPSCRIRLGTNSETSRVSTGKFTVTRHKNRSCKYMEDMYCENDYINMTPTRHSLLITSESGDELISLREQFIGRAEQHVLQHYCITERTTCTTSELVGEQYSGPCGKSCTDLTLWKVVLWTAHTLVDANELLCFQFLGMLLSAY